MPTIESCGSRLFYERTGTGDPVLLIHSSACRGGFWRGLTRDVGAGFSYYTPDLAGYGRSSCGYLNDKTGLQEEAEFVSPLLWDGDEPFHVIGHSFGGAIALAAATSWPDRVRSLTLYEPTAFSLLRGRGAPDAELFQTVLQVRAEMQKRVAGGSHDGAMGHFVDFWNGPGAWDKRPLAERDQLSPLAGKVVSDFRMLFEALWKPEAFRRARFPVLILRGDRSPPAAARVAEILADLIGHARLVTVAGVGHMVPVTDSGLIAATIREHIRASGSPEHLEAALKAPRDPTPSQEVTHGNVAARSEFLSIPAPGRESAA